MSFAYRLNRVAAMMASWPHRRALAYFLLLIGASGALVGPVRGEVPIERGAAPRGQIIVPDLSGPTATAPAPDQPDRTNLAPGQEGPRRWALCIGIDHYHTDQYPPLTCAVNDAKSCAAEFKSLGYQTVLMTDDATDEKLRPTYGNLDRELYEFAVSATNPDDSLIITFAGHGDLIGGQTGLLPLDYGELHRMVTLSHVLECLSDPRCRAGGKLLVLDCCRSAGERPERRLSSGFLQSLGSPESFLVLSGCGEKQYSLEDPATGHGRLTAVLLEGLGGKAFAKDKEFLQAQELADWIQAAFRDRHWTKQQSPELFGRTTASVAFYIARRDLPKPPALSAFDKQLLGMSLKSAEESLVQKQYTQSVEAANAALRFDAKSADALAIRSLDYFSMGYPDKSVEDAEEALAAEPQNLLAIQARAQLLLRDGEGETSQRQALALFQRVVDGLATTPKRWPFLLTAESTAKRFLAIGMILSRTLQDQDGAAASFDRAMAVADAPIDDLVRAVVDRGIVHSKQSRWEKAVLDWHRAIVTPNASPDQVTLALVGEGIALRHIEKPDGLLADWDGVIAATASAPGPRAQALINRASAWRRSGHQDKELADYISATLVHDVPFEQLARALTARGGYFGRTGNSAAAIRDYTRVVRLRGVDAEQVAISLVNRGDRYSAVGRDAEAIADWTQVIQMKKAPAEQVAWALYYRALAYSNAHAPQNAFKDYDQVIGMPDVDSDLLTDALINRGGLHGLQGELGPAVEDLTRAMHIPDRSSDQMARALVSRGFAYAQQNRTNDALADFKAAVETKDILATRAALALIGRIYLFEGMGKADAEIAECSRLIGWKDAPPARVAQALVFRARAYRTQSRWDPAVADATRVIGMKDAPPEQLVLALIGRAFAYRGQGQTEQQLADLTRAVGMSGMPGVSPEQQADALNDRAAFYVDAHRLNEALADFSAGIQIAGTPDSSLAYGLNGRGAVYRKLKRLAEAEADFTRVLKLAEAPAESKGRALDRRGDLRESQGRFEEALQDYSAQVELKGIPDWLLGGGLTNRGWLLYEMGQLEKAMPDCRRAFALMPDDPVPAYNVALILLRQEKLDEAKAAYETALKVRPLEASVDDLIDLRDKYHGPAETIAFLGWMRIVNGHREPGLQDLNRYLQDHPQGGAADWARQWLLLTGPPPVPATKVSQ